jgi:hypothetical protein
MECNLIWRRIRDWNLSRELIFFEEKAVSIQSSNQGKIKITGVGLNLGRRILVSAMLGALTIVMPAIENLQRWASDEDESWREEA